MYVDADMDDETRLVAEDSDVSLERQRLHATDPAVLQSIDSIVLSNLTKHYSSGNIVAVDRSVAVAAISAREASLLRHLD